MTRDLAELPAAAACARLFAVDPWLLGGILLRSRAGPMRDRWLADLRALLPAGTPVRRLPSQADEDRMFGGLDLAATLASGRPVTQRGLLAETDGGVLVVPMAERLPAAAAARLGAVLEDAVLHGADARFGIIALDEGIDDEHVVSALADRLAFWIDPEGDPPVATEPGEAGWLADARRSLPAVQVDDAVLETLAETALALGVASLRASVMAVRAARVAAALGGRHTVAAADAAVAARLILAPRATRLPAPPPSPEAGDAAPPEQPAPPDADADADTSPAPPKVVPTDVVLAAAKAAIPADLLARLAAGLAPRARKPAAGRAGARHLAARKGRPAGNRRGMPGGGARLDVIATLRAAAPWQTLRAASAGRLAIRRDDLRIKRVEERSGTTTVFVVDASGSLAASRLAEAKGAVELLLAECYVRRDEVALIAFRGTGAALLLPPTRSLARAKRSLADLPGGGATPLARAIDAASALADQIRRRGRTPVVVFLTDGRANVARDGSAGRGKAGEDALHAARQAREAGFRTLVVDAAVRPQASAEALAQAMGSLYVPLPRAEAGSLSRAVQAAIPG